ncbi:transcription factor GTE4 isoform X2 [Phoenix dactylifera]|uniref:Transcription factor GTE4 isoform X2 n=1 Tax=Phoenix dactylifera TaxID=42345 RepID=A0A8B7BRJ9_PHODC|nr:transcription factor GTE4 isoform X2 [Phoenix dactylifera]XP_008783915.1 transcription factor GTE4 isoform X2 [Phoenix dactylifera]
MASGPLVGGGAGGDGSWEKQRWAESNKVYTRKSHKKTPKPTSNPRPPPSSDQAPTAAAAADAAASSVRHPPPLQPPAPSSVASDDDASSLNRPQLPDGAQRSQHNCHSRSVTIRLASRSRQEIRELRRKLTAELDQIRSLSRKIEVHEVQLASAAAAASSAPAAGYTHSQLSVTDPKTPISSKTPGSAPFRRQLSVSVATDNNPSEGVEKEKRTPKANQYYRNSDFVLGKEKFPPEPHAHKKSKANGGKKHSLGELDYGAQAAESKLYTQAFKSCAALLSKLMKHKHGWVFNSPVDAKALGLHDYFSIIKRPMDLGTVKSRLSKNWYKSPREFAEDVRLTFRNAMTYNPEGQDVHIMAKQISQIFEERWPAIEAEFAYLSQPPAPKKPPPLDTRILERSDSTICPVAVDSKTKPVNYAPHVGRPPALKKPKAKDPHKRDMTFEEKQRLSNNLQNLPPQKLEIIVQIIRKRNSSVNQHDDEIEVDIDSVDVETLWELDRFVTNYKKSLSKNKRKAELAVLARRVPEHNTREMVHEGVPEPIIVEMPDKSKTVADEKYVATSSPAGEEKKGDNASRSSSSSSSSSDSGSSSSDSDSESSSAYGSEAAHSPRT